MAVQRLLLVLAVLTASPCALAGPVSCAASDETVFACRTARKQVAVCGSPGWSQAQGSLQYRFGTAREAELVLPASAMPPQSSARAGTLMLSGGGGAWLRFRRGDTDYVVYTAIGSFGEKSGVAVERGGRRLASLPCRGPVTSQLGDELFRKGAFARDAGDFDLPD